MIPECYQLLDHFALPGFNLDHLRAISAIKWSFLNMNAKARCALDKLGDKLRLSVRDSYSPVPLLFAVFPTVLTFGHGAIALRRSDDVSSAIIIAEAGENSRCADSPNSSLQYSRVASLKPTSRGLQESVIE